MPLVKYESDNSPVLMFIYNLFRLPVESAYADSISYYALLNRYQFDTVILVLEIILGIFLWILMLYYARRKGWRFFCPSVRALFAFLRLRVYLPASYGADLYIPDFLFLGRRGHAAVKLLPLESAERTEELLPLENAERTEELLPLENAERTEELLSAENAEQEEGLLPEKRKEPAERRRKVCRKPPGKRERRKTRLVRRLLYYCAALSIAISCTFSIISGINEVLEPLWLRKGRAIAAFLKSTGLRIRGLCATGSLPIQTKFLPESPYSPYFQENIIYNVNDGEDSLGL